MAKAKQRRKDNVDTRKRPALSESPRPLRLEWIDPATLDGNPQNWRVHPANQTAALRDVIAEVGWAGALLYNERTKRLIDGHARKEMFAGQGPVPVLIGSWDEATEKKILATLDPIAAMAEADAGKLDALLRDVQTGSEAIADMLMELAGTEPEKPKDRSAELHREYSVLVRCEQEQDQQAILAELDKFGLDVRAITIDVPERPKKEDTPGPALGPGEFEIRRECNIKRTPRVMQCEGMFDIPPSKKACEKWRLNLQLDRPWSVGLIVGPSGSGKSTVARELFGKNIVQAWPWSEDRAIIDDFPVGLGVSEITGILSSVGFSSPPSWLKPFHVLSNGEQFRVTMARTLAEAGDLAVIDEFTSVVDRTVAKIGSAAFAKSIRGTGRKFIAVSCHYDIEEWLQPDWKLEMPGAKLAWRSLRRRPEIQLSVKRAGAEAWTIFRRHHYLSTDLARPAACFVGTVEGQPACFTACLYTPSRQGGFWREHRTVCLPDFQGVGLGNAMSEFVAGVMLAKGKRYHSTTSHPAMIRHRMKSPLWRCVRPPSRADVSGSNHPSSAASAYYRLTAGFQFIGPPRPEAAEVLGIGPKTQ